MGTRVTHQMAIFASAVDVAAKKELLRGYSPPAFAAYLQNTGYPRVFQWLLPMIFFD
jgi:hypothetical protein